MSALVCCGPIFDSSELKKDSNLYGWLDNMISSQEPRVCNACIVEVSVNPKMFVTKCIMQYSTFLLTYERKTAYIIMSVNSNMCYII